VTADEILRVRRLVKRYPGSAAPAVNGLDFTVAPGECFGLLGPNGAGKTTAISVICTLLRPTSGSVEVCGIDAQRDPVAVRRVIGLAPQDVALYTSLTARENLEYFGRLCGLSGRTLQSRIEECLALVGLEDTSEKRVSTFSGGMRRRANLAAAILHAPRVLLLDEPTVGIDAQSRNLILDNLRVLRAAGMTLVYTTHYMEEAAQLCDRIAIIDQGSLVASGEPQALVGRIDGCANLEDLFLRLTGTRLRD
jgi:ABC-2 type transport system ATP-binding protein